MNNNTLIKALALSLPTLISPDALALANCASDFQFSKDHNLPDNVVSLQISASDFSSLASKDLRGAVLANINNKVYECFQDDFHFVNVIRNLDRNVSDGANQTNYHRLGNSNTQLTTIFYPNRSNIAYGASLHEIGHTWSNRIVEANDLQGKSVGGHWGLSDANGAVGGFDPDKLTFSSGVYRYAGSSINTQWGTNAIPYSDLELYMMGIMDKASVSPLNVYRNPRNVSLGSDAITFNADRHVYSVEDIEELAFSNVNGFTGSSANKSFRSIHIVATVSPLTQSEWEEVSTQVSWFSHPGDDSIFADQLGDSAVERLNNFWEATKGKGKLNAEGLSDFLLGAGKTNPPRASRKPVNICWTGSTDEYDAYINESVNELNQNYNQKYGFRLSCGLDNDSFGMLNINAGASFQVSQATIDKVSINTDTTDSACTQKCYKNQVKELIFKGLAVIGSLKSESPEKVTTKHYHNCQLKDDASVSCWGSNSFGGADAPLESFKQVTVGNFHSCGIKLNNEVQCWGYNGNGQTQPIQGVYKNIVGGDYATCGINNDNETVCWGRLSYLPPQKTKVKQLKLGSYHSCAIMLDDSIQCWGSNFSGSATPPAGKFSKLSTNYSQNCAVSFDGNVTCWGQNNYGQTNFPAGNFVDVSMGWGHACALRADGAINCWGLNEDGQATPPNQSFTEVHAGMRHTCGVTSENTVQCWGRNADGETNVPL
ncbi:RCC1 domain-containing protein [Hahella sp. NBU794]|uniref:RCC1 domain-containing protein n=1 Tax=Hahella sp. NBU794 TaxID=3422590 RepID=UPI003D6FBA13